MKYVSEFREEVLASGIVHEIKRLTLPIRIMEVCGGHTHVICRFGLRELLPREIELIHGPGCPVCVIPQETLETAIELANRPDTIICCFGDVMRVPTSRGTLLSLSRGRGSVRMVYSPLEVIKLAQEHPEKEIIFLAIGFETTAPSTAMALKRARSLDIHNFKVLSTHFTVPQALRILVEDKSSKIGAFVAPGHVTTVIGTGAYEFLCNEFKRPVVVSGFEPLDLLQSVLFILRQAKNDTATVENQYTRAVRREGNTIALDAMAEVFVPRSTHWRGLGVIPDSGLAIAPEYAGWDAEKVYDIPTPSHSKEPPGCLCGNVLKGIVYPTQCSHFGTSCRPDSPIGPCMVSPEGACAAHYRYGVQIETL